MLTKSDILKLKEIFVTKEEFRELKSDVIQLRNDVSKLKNDAKQLQSDVSQLKSMLHEVIFELRDMREEFIAITYRNRDHSDKIESHEIRITTLEKKLST